jgi:hypothetical protein
MKVGSMRHVTNCKNTLQELHSMRHEMCAYLTLVLQMLLLVVIGIPGINCPSFLPCGSIPPCACAMHFLSTCRT